MATLRTGYAAALKWASEKAAKDADEASAQALTAETAVLAQGIDPPATDTPQVHGMLTTLRAPWRKSAATEAAKLLPLLDIYEKELTTLEQATTGQNATAISARRQDIAARRAALLGQAQ